MIKVFPGPVSGKGRGVLARAGISCGEVIEIAPVIVFPKEQWEQIAETEFSCFCYFWGTDMEDGALALGLGSLYNHSYEPNARYIRHIESQTMEYVAIKDIEEGEEVTINYNGSPDNRSPVWFDVL